jgi:exopolysaccharide production protein ExoY
VHTGESIFAMLLLAGFLPVVSIAALVILALSRRSPLIAHLRVGQFGRPLWTYKLRTMWPAACPGEPWRRVEYLVDEQGPENKTAGDARVTSAFARFCRRFSIDELPQLWNVVRGEMSIVGPRPLTRSELDLHYGADAVEVLEAKPGITGLWQVEGRNRLTYAERRERDLYLVRHRCWKLYLRILLRTGPTVLGGENGW